MTSRDAEISLRPVQADDREVIFRWRNDPFILSHGSSNREVSWAEHCKWFDETLRESDRKLFVIQNKNAPIGQVRFDRQNQRECVISAYLLREFTGHGWGVEAIREACKAILDAWDVESVIACVRKDNPGGRSAFLKAGFESMDADVCPAHHYSLVLRSRVRQSASH